MSVSTAARWAIAIRNSFSSHCLCRLVCAIFLLVVYAPIRAADSGPLTFEAALRAAEHHSLALRGYEAGARAAGERAVAAGQLPDPVLQFGLDNVPTQGNTAFGLDNEPMTMRKVGLMQTYTRPAKRRARAAQFQREAEAAKVRRTASLAELRERAALTWLALYYRQQQLTLVMAQREEAARQVQAADAEFRGGRGDQTNLFAARLSLAELDDELKALRAQLASTRHALERWTGLPQPTELSSPPSIRTTHWSNHGPEHSLDLHPDIAAMNAEERAAIARAEVARQETRGDWTWSLMYASRGADYADMVSLGVSIPLEWNRKNRQNRELAAELARVDQVQAQKEEMRRSHQLEIEQLLIQWEAQLARLDHYQKTLLPLAEESVQAALAGYRGNRLSLSELLATRRAAIGTDIERLRIEEEAAALWATLEFRFPELERSTTTATNNQSQANTHSLESAP
jgi:outer membrane protein TolC